MQIRIIPEADNVKIAEVRGTWSCPERFFRAESPMDERDIRFATSKRGDPLRATIVCRH